MELIMKGYSFFVFLILVGANTARAGDPRIVETTFDTVYIQENANKVRVVIPAAYELGQIVYTLSELQNQNYGRSYSKGKYYQEVQEYFSDFADHHILPAVNYENWTDYWSFRQNSIAYSYKDTKLVNDGVYRTLWDMGEDEFQLNRKALEDFASLSNFGSFYTAHSDYYAALTAEFSSIVNPDGMRLWLEDNFSARYDSYLIVISPLVGGAHNFAIVSDQNFKEAIITISAPNVFDSKRNDEGQVPKEVALKFSRLVFTELDHNYVNPVSERFTTKIKENIGEITRWNESDDYTTAFSTFNEYVTWAIFPMYVRSIYGDAYFNEAMSDVNRQMLRRGFVRFPEFSRWLNSADIQLTEGKSLESVFEEIIAWFGRGDLQAIGK
jgi:hypothetical protein